MAAESDILDRHDRHRRLPRPRAGLWSHAVVGVLCLYLGGLLVANLGNLPFGSDLASIYPRFGGLDETSLQVAWQDIENNYVLRGVPGRVGTEASEAALVQAIDSTYDDRFSAYFTRSEYQQFSSAVNQDRSGSIGISIEETCAGATLCASGQNPTALAVEDVLHAQPAERAGLRNGDVLVAVGTTQVSSLGSDLDARLSRLSDLIDGEAGTTVTLTVDRGGAQLAFTATRGNLQIPTVYSRMFGRVLDLQVTSFGEDTGQDAVAALKSGLAEGATAVVLDLRGNGGGYVTSAVTLASQFLTPHGSEQDVVVRRGRMDLQGQPTTAQTVIHDQIQSGGLAPAVPLVVLVDGGSASASEIVTAALRDYHRATVVGTTTYGKGSVQIDYPLPDGSDLHLTVEKWYGPDGESIDGTGITPDDVVSLPGPNDLFTLEAESADPAQDPQLQAALAVARG
ncbi:MAG: S41 family peptidase [Candidatus Dormibacteria bacterium]|jgi:carboxyl-terminal processing protease